MIFPGALFSLDADNIMVASIDPALILADVEEMQFTAGNRMIFVLTPWNDFSAETNSLTDENGTALTDENGDSLIW